jgi:hypothetical protein
VLATVEDVVNAGNETKEYTDEQLSEHAEDHWIIRATLDEKGFTQLSNAIAAVVISEACTPLAVRLAVEAAITAAWELDNPVGTVKFYSQNVNPNERYPWTTWIYTGENRYPHIGAAVKRRRADRRQR